ncbi:NAD(P)/FAD-dependent oxidoreductase [Acuticoccus kandeliae]|uniref:NAD(P)/FAD-dependent oxidoreductase n=1 Tax=Acuticoccus kandeliae TaxID=2073160 RepID=UPI001475C3A1|nr:NAD(P)/FAD-dependent oxidoreductase [Acuticoccus kandeliae]
MIVRSMASYDAVIVGGRCAGAATAMLLARRGLKVLVVEKRSYGSDTISTHALMRGGAMQLARWGLMPHVLANATLVRRAVFTYGDERVEVPIAPGGGLDGLVAPRRTVLDPILADAAMNVGAEFRFGVAFQDVVRDPNGRVRGIALRRADGSTEYVTADLVIGADGIASNVARVVGARTDHEGAHASAVLYAYWDGISLDGYEWGYGDQWATGAIPTHDGRTCVFAAIPSERFRAMADRPAGEIYQAVLAGAHPTLRDMLAGGRMVEKVRGFGGKPGHLRQAAGPGWALVGDAGYFKDPLTAHGITDALRDAELLADAVTSGGAGAFAEYEEVRNTLSLPFLKATDEIASFAPSMERLKALHMEINRLMKVEVAVMRDRFGAAPERSAPVWTAHEEADVAFPFLARAAHNAAQAARAMR